MNKVNLRNKKGIVAKMGDGWAVFIFYGLLVTISVSHIERAYYGDDLQSVITIQCCKRI